MKLKVFYFLVLVACGAHAALLTGAKGTPLVDADGKALADQGVFTHQLPGWGGWAKPTALALFRMSPAERLQYLRDHQELGGVNGDLLQAAAPAPRPHPLPSAAATREQAFEGRAPLFSTDETLARALEASMRDHKPLRPAAAAAPLRATGPSANLAIQQAIHEWEQLPFQTVQGGSGGMIDIGYDASGRTDQYRPYNFPKAPMLHTYHPYKGAGVREDHMWRGAHHVPHVSINLRARTDLFRDRLPEAAKAAIRDIPSDNLDIFWIVQNNPWTGSAQVLFRPHYWLDPNAPFEDGRSYEKKFTTNVRILSSIPEGIAFNDPVLRVSTHGGAGYVISSPANAHIPGAARPNETFSFWSLTQANGRSAITLHWLLNERDNDLILEAINRSHNLRNLLGVFNEISQHRGSPILRTQLLPELDNFLDFPSRR